VARRQETAYARRRIEAKPRFSRMNVKNSLRAAAPPARALDRSSSKSLLLRRSGTRWPSAPASSRGRSRANVPTIRRAAGRRGQKAWMTRPYHGRPEAP
jgi:hypothetical protein